MNIPINDHLSIPEKELHFTYSRSSGPGGQHVNTTDTRVTLIFDVDGSPSLTDFQKKRLHEKLGNRIARDGALRLSGEEHRSRKRNRDSVVERFVTLLRDALKRRRKRRATRPTKAAIRRRIAAKKQRGDLKKNRRPPSRDD
jgi:ribosome-associated protein